MVSDLISCWLFWKADSPGCDMDMDEQISHSRILTSYICMSKIQKELLSSHHDDIKKRQRRNGGH